MEWESQKLERKLKYLKKKSCSPPPLGYGGKDKNKQTNVTQCNRNRHTVRPLHTGQKAHWHPAFVHRPPLFFSMFVTSNMTQQKKTKHRQTCLLATGKDSTTYF